MAIENRPAFFFAWFGVAKLGAVVAFINTHVMGKPLTHALEVTNASHVIVGHSERRVLHGESDAQTAAKFVAAQRAGLTPVLCVGETLAERDAKMDIARAMGRRAKGKD